MEKVPEGGPPHEKQARTRLEIITCCPLREAMVELAGVCFPQHSAGSCTSHKMEVCAVPE